MVYVEPRQGQASFHRIVHSEISNFGSELQESFDFEIVRFHDSPPGNVIRKTQPGPPPEAINESEPPCTSTADFAIARPSPVPP